MAIACLLRLPPSPEAEAAAFAERGFVLPAGGSASYYDAQFQQRELLYTIFDTFHFRERASSAVPPPPRYAMMQLDARHFLRAAFRQLSLREAFTYDVFCFADVCFLPFLMLL